MENAGKNRKKRRKKLQTNDEDTGAIGRKQEKSQLNRCKRLRKMAREMENYGGNFDRVGNQRKLDGKFRKIDVKIKKEKYRANARVRGNNNEKYLR